MKGSYCLAVVILACALAIPALGCIFGIPANNYIQEQSKYVCQKQAKIRRGPQSRKADFGRLLYCLIHFTMPEKDYWWRRRRDVVAELYGVNFSIAVTDEQLSKILEADTMLITFGVQETYKGDHGIKIIDVTCLDDSGKSRQRRDMEIMESDPFTLIVDYKDNCLDSEHCVIMAEVTQEEDESNESTLVRVERHSAKPPSKTKKPTKKPNTHPTTTTMKTTMSPKTTSQPPTNTAQTKPAGTANATASNSTLIALSSAAGKNESTRTNGTVGIDEESKVNDKKTQGGDKTNSTKEHEKNSPSAPNIDDVSLSSANSDATVNEDSKKTAGSASSQDTATKKPAMEATTKKGKDDTTPKPNSKASTNKTSITDTTKSNDQDPNKTTGSPPTNKCGGKGINTPNIKISSPFDYLWLIIPCVSAALFSVVAWICKSFWACIKRSLLWLFSCCMPNAAANAVPAIPVEQTGEKNELQTFE